MMEKVIPPATDVFRNLNSIIWQDWSMRAKK